MTDHDTLKADYEKWLETVLKPSEAKARPRKETFTRSDGAAVEPLYWPCEDFDYASKLGWPGAYPFTRGVQPNMYRGRMWTMRQYAGFASAEESNARYRYLLEQGQTGLSVAFDLPTQMGYDSDHPLARGEVGKVGVAIDTLEDMRILFGGIPLDRVSTSMTINSTAAVLLAMYIAVAEENGVSADKLTGTIQNDVLKEYIARGTYIYPPGPSLRIITDIFDYCSRQVPQWNTISISGYHIREAGSDAVQEVAFTLADGVTYVKAAVDRGLDVDKFAGRLAFFFGVANNFLEEVAKFRAARRMWARIMRERFAAKSRNSLLLRFHTQTAGYTLTAQQPLNNVVRVTLQALAAVLGGTQSLHTNSFDEALALPTQEAVTVALRTQQIIGFESGVADFVDPLGGAYAIEAMTDHIDREATALMERIESMGGMLRAIESGFVKRAISDTSYRYQKAVESTDQVVVGLNKFTAKETRTPDILRVDPAVEEKQRSRIAAVRGARDEGKTQQALARVVEAARTTENLVPFILAAVKSMATLGEISAAMESVFGRFEEIIEI
jgi:methylmalonyl-CoA mutase N-terminal domain/subunit